LKVDHSGTGYITNPLLFGNGRFLVEVVEALRGVPDVEINIWMSGVNMEFAQLENGITYDVAIGNRTSYAYPQSCKLDEFSSIRDLVKLPQQKYRFEMNADSGNYVSAGFYAGNMTEPRPSLISGINFPASTNGEIVDNTLFSVSTTLMDYYSAMYLCRKGSMRWSFQDLFGRTTLPLTPTVINQVATGQRFLTTGDLHPSDQFLGSAACQLMVNQDSPLGTETVDVPVLFPCEFVNPNGQPTTEAMDCVYFRRYVTGSIQSVILQSGADDYSLSSWRYVPPMKFGAYT
jgi:hypothetical protein